jgi:hypothetical protein
MRDCLQDISIDGVTIPAGVKVGFGLASANRDARTYDGPDEFRLDRPSAKDHLAFGGGPHVCPGASLARLEGRVALDVFLDRVDHANVHDGYRREPVPVFWANGPRRLPVNLTAAGPNALRLPDNNQDVDLRGVRGVPGKKPGVSSPTGSPVGQHNRVDRKSPL